MEESSTPKTPTISKFVKTSNSISIEIKLNVVATRIKYKDKDISIFRLNNKKKKIKKIVAKT